MIYKICVYLNQKKIAFIYSYFKHNRKVYFNNILVSTCRILEMANSGELFRPETGKQVDEGWGGGGNGHRQTKLYRISRHFPQVFPSAAPLLFHSNFSSNIGMGMKHQ